MLLHANWRVAPSDLSVRPVNCGAQGRWFKSTRRKIILPRLPLCITFPPSIAQGHRLHFSYTAGQKMVKVNTFANKFFNHWKIQHQKEILRIKLFKVVLGLFHFYVECGHYAFPPLFPRGGRKGLSGWLSFMCWWVPLSPTVKITE